MRIGLMGGTFDPIHIGHLVAGECALEAARLDEVWFMPTFKPPHKSQSSNVSAEDRLEMVRLAIRNHPRFRPCDIELKKGGVSYSIDTVSLLHSLYPEHQFFYIIGADMIRYLPKWHRIDDLRRMVTFIGLRRPGYELQQDAHEDAVILADMPQIDISSTWVRARMAAGLSIRYVVPDQVREYIEVNRIYEA